MQSIAAPPGAIRAPLAYAEDRPRRHTRTFCGFPPATLAALLVLWSLCNPFHAVDASSLIYAARALADLDPSGVGRDLMFSHDGQSGFTIFTGIFDALARRVGVSQATTMAAAASVAAGFAGAVAVACGVATGRTRALVVVFAATLPAYYGGYKLFSYAEVAATPRPFTEALVLFGLVALLRRRHGLAALLMACATILHPIMATAGVGVLVTWLILEDRRWLVLALILGLAILALAAAGVAPFDRLQTLVDPQWKAILLGRSPQLFPSLWPSGWIGRSAARMATLLIAAGLVAAPVRRLFLVTAVVCLAGFATAYLLNDRVGSLLLLQAQTWRMMWLVFALATAAAAICAVELWRRAGTARLALAFLALAWAYADSDPVAVIFAIVALGIHYAIHPKRYARFGTCIHVTVALLFVWFAAALFAGAWSTLHVASEAGPALADDARRTIALSYDYTLLAVAITVLVIAGRPRVDGTALAAIAAAGAALLVGTWDQRSDANHYIDAGGGVPDLEKLLATRPGEVYWIDGARETWWWLHRPQWTSPIQGAGIVFSRSLSIVYQDRARRVIEAGLADHGILAPMSTPFAMRIPSILPERVRPFCARRTGLDHRATR